MFSIARVGPELYVHEAFLVALFMLFTAPYFAITDCMRALGHPLMKLQKTSDEPVSPRAALLSQVPYPIAPALGVDPAAPAIKAETHYLHDQLAESVWRPR